MTTKIGAGLTTVPRFLSSMFLVAVFFTSFTLAAPIQLAAQSTGDFQLFGVNLSGTLPWMNNSGRTVTDGQLTTPDGRLSLKIPSGTFIRNAVGIAQPFISATLVANPPTAPSQHTLIIAYALGTPGATFNPTVGLTFSYTDADLPPAVAETSLYVAWWNGSEWVKLIGQVDPATNTVAASVANFTTYALFGMIQPLPALKISTPAAGASLDSGSATMSITVENLKLVAGEKPNAVGEGRIIYYLDVAVPTAPGKTALSAVGTFTETVTTTNSWSNLAPGSHTMGVQLVQNDRTPFNPPVYATVSVTIKVPSATSTTLPPFQTTSSPDTGNNLPVPVFFLAGAVILVFVLFLRARAK